MHAHSLGNDTNQAMNNKISYSVRVRLVLVKEAIRIKT